MTQRTTLAAFRRSIPVLALSLALFACSDDKDNGNNEKIEGNSLLLNFTSNYETGELRWMQPDSARLSEGTLSFHQDSKVSTAEGNIFILSSYPGTLACLSPQSIGDKSAIKEKRLDTDNPYEATAIGSKGYIALNDADSIQVFNISTCTPSEKIGLPTLEENAPTNASTIKASGDTLLLTLQRLENWAATKPGLLVRINAKTKTLIDTIQLNFYNPKSSVFSKGKLYVSSQKYNDDYSIDLEKSGVEVVDLAKGTSEVLATGTELGGGANDIALDEAHQILYVSVYVYYGLAPVKPVNLKNKAIGFPLEDIEDSFAGIVFDYKSKKLFIADASGLKFYDPSKIYPTIPIDEGENALPPYSLAIVNF